MRTACMLSSFLGASGAGHKEGCERPFLTNSTVICPSLFLSIYLQYIKLFLLQRYKSWDSWDSIVTRPSAGRPRNCGSIHGTGNRIFTSPKRPDRFLGPMNLPQGVLSTGFPQPANYPPLSSCEIKVCAAVYCVRNVVVHGDAREGKWRGNWRMEWVASTLTRPRNVVYPALLPLMRTPRLPAVDWTDSPADLNGPVRLGERRNLVSARVPSGSARALLPFTHVFTARCLVSAHTTLHLTVTVTRVTDRNSTISHGDTTTECKPDKGCPQGEFCLTFVVPCGKRPPGGATKGRFSGLWLGRWNSHINRGEVS